MKEVQDATSSVREMPPVLGIFNDIPSHKLREDEVCLSNPSTHLPTLAEKSSRYCALDQHFMLICFCVTSCFSSQVMAWARAGFSFIVCDGEHSQLYGRYGREQHAMLARAGLLSVQRLHREAVSEHGDAFQLGARATMRPYGTTVEDARQYLRAVHGYDSHYHILLWITSSISLRSHSPWENRRPPLEMIEVATLFV